MEKHNLLDDERAWYESNHSRSMFSQSSNTNYSYLKMDNPNLLHPTSKYIFLDSRNIYMTIITMEQLLIPNLRRWKEKKTNLFVEKVFEKFNELMKECFLFLLFLSLLFLADFTDWVQLYCW